MINFTKHHTKFGLNLHYNGANGYLLTEQKFINLKQKTLKSYQTLCLGNASKNFTSSNIIKTGLNGYIYNFSVDYDAIAVDDILDICRYLMKNNSMI